MPIDFLYPVTIVITGLAEVNL